MEKLTATLMHGHGSPVEYLPDGGIKTAPRCNEPVECKRAPMAWHLIPRLTWTASGYGERIPTEYMVKWCGRWRRVYCRVYCHIFSNVGTLYIGRGKERIIVDIEGGN